MESKEYKEVTMHIVEIKQHDVICTSPVATVQNYDWNYEVEE